MKKEYKSMNVHEEEMDEAKYHGKEKGYHNGTNVGGRFNQSVGEVPGS